MALQSEELTEAPSTAPRKRPYRRPEVRRLGSVAELTLLNNGATSFDPSSHLTNKVNT
jgi:hypothetical protein